MITKLLDWFYGGPMMQWPPNLCLRLTGHATELPFMTSEYSGGKMCSCGSHMHIYCRGTRCRCTLVMIECLCPDMPAVREILDRQPGRVTTPDYFTLPYRHILPHRRKAAAVSACDRVTYVFSACEAEYLVYLREQAKVRRRGRGFIRKLKDGVYEIFVCVIPGMRPVDIEGSACLSYERVRLAGYCVTATPEELRAAAIHTEDTGIFD